MSVQVDNVIGRKGLGRIDEGVDFSGRGPVGAVGDGVITYVSTSTGWPGGTFIKQKLADGRYVYYAENIRPSVRVGQRVQKGQQIGYAPGVYPFIEVGWAVPGSADLAAAHSHYTEGQQTAEGKSFYNFLFGGGKDPGGAFGGGGGGGGSTDGGDFLSDPVGTIVNGIFGGLAKTGVRMLLYVVLVFGGIGLAVLGTQRTASSRSMEPASV